MAVPTSSMLCASHDISTYAYTKCITTYSVIVSAIALRSPPGMRQNARVPTMTAIPTITSIATKPPTPDCIHIHKIELCVMYSHHSKKLMSGMAATI